MKSFLVKLAITLLLALSCFWVYYFWIKFYLKIVDEGKDPTLPTETASTGGTSSGSISSWSFNDIVYPPEDPREYIDYITLRAWILWKDYFVEYPAKPPIIRSATKVGNNDVMYTYVDRKSSVFTIPKSGRVWYIMFTTQKEIPNNKDFFLALNGKVLWHIKKNASLPVFDTNEYLYDMRDFPLIKGKRNLYDYVQWSNLTIAWFVGEPWNYVTKIVIVFR